jgi:hypothetical protein
MFPTTTLQGVNYRVTARRIPLYVKVIDFLQRHYQYGPLVSRICAAKTSDADCVMAIFDWTHENIRPTPAGWPIIDDHPLHIVIRGYGESDQMADVFATLSVYAGVPAFLSFLEEARHGERLVLAFAKIEGQWTVFDVQKHVVFKDRQGNLASVDTLVGDPALVDQQTHGLRPGVRYSTFISKELLSPFVVPRPLRTELQQPGPRIRYELRRALGLQPG